MQKQDHLRLQQIWISDINKLKVRITAIAFDVNDPDKDFLKFKTGLARDLLDYISKIRTARESGIFLMPKAILWMLHCLTNVLITLIIISLFNYGEYFAGLNFNPQWLSFSVKIDVSNSICGIYRLNVGPLSF